MYTQYYNVTLQLYKNELMYIPVIEQLCSTISKKAQYYIKERKLVF